MFCFVKFFIKKDGKRRVPFFLNYLEVLKEQWLTFHTSTRVLYVYSSAELANCCPCARPQGIVAKRKCICDTGTNQSIECKLTERAPSHRESYLRPRDAGRVPGDTSRTPSVKRLTKVAPRFAQQGKRSRCAHQTQVTKR